MFPDDEPRIPPELSELQDIGRTLEELQFHVESIARQMPVEPAPRLDSEGRPTLRPHSTLDSIEDSLDKIGRTLVDMKDAAEAIQGNLSALEMAGDRSQEIRDHLAAIQTRLDILSQRTDQAATATATLLIALAVLGGVALWHFW